MDETEEYKKIIKKHHDKYATTMSQKGELYEFKQNLIKKYTDKKSNILDLGCGNGLFAIPLSKNVKNIVAVDFSTKMISELKRRIKMENIHNIHTLNSDFSDTKLQNNSFDTAISFSTLYYIKNLDQVFSLVNKSLKPKGVFIFDTLNMKSLGALYYSKKYSFYQNFMDISKLKSKLKEFDFEIIDEYCFELIPSFSFIKGIMDVKLKGKTIDFILSNPKILKQFSFRYIFVCKKVD